MGNSASQIARRQYPTKGALNLSKELPVKSGASELANGEDKTHAGDAHVNIELDRTGDSIKELIAGQGSNVLQGLASSDLDDDEQKDLDFGSVLDKLGGAIKGRTLPNEQVRTHLSMDQVLLILQSVANCSGVHWSDAFVRSSHGCAGKDAWLLQIQASRARWTSEVTRCSCAAVRACKAESAGRAVSGGSGGAGQKICCGSRNSAPRVGIQQVATSQYRSIIVKSSVT